MAAVETPAQRAAGKLSGRFQAYAGRFFMFDDVGDGDDDDDEDEVVLPLFSRFIPSCVHSEATYCIDSFTEAGTLMLHTCEI